MHIASAVRTMHVIGRTKLMTQNELHTLHDDLIKNMKQSRPGSGEDNI